MAVQLVLVPATNFGGLDEWLELELASRGVVAVPYAYRPLGLLWAVPPAGLAPIGGFAAFRWCYGLYLFLSSALVFGLVRRLAPQSPFLGLAAAAITVAWAPADMGKLSTVESAVYQGITVGALLAVALLARAWPEGGRVWFAAALVMAFVAIRSYEGTAALLAFAPLLVFVDGRGAVRRWGWLAAWLGVIALGAGLVLLEVALSGQRDSYQLVVMGQADPDPAAWLTRVARQYDAHLRPLVATRPRDLWSPAVLAAAAAWFGGAWSAARAPAAEGRCPRRLWAAAALGLTFAGLGYAVVVIGWHLPTSFRLQFLSGPGMALFLAAAARLAAGVVPRGHRLVAAVLVAWVIAVGTARTAAMQEEWRENNYYPAQVRMLSELVRAVPAVAPGTLVIAVDEGDAWLESFSFHHAVQYLYERRAAGVVHGRANLLYRVVGSDQGVVFEPWPIIRRAWDAPRTAYRWEDVVVVRHTATGEVLVADRWPPEFGAAPPGYAPRARIREGRSRRAAILD